MKPTEEQQAIIESKPFDAIRGKMLYPVDRHDKAAIVADIRNRRARSMVAGSAVAAGTSAVVAVVAVSPMV